MRRTKIQRSMCQPIRTTVRPSRKATSRKVPAHVRVVSSFVLTVHIDYVVVRLCCSTFVVASLIGT